MASKNSGDEIRIVIIGGGITGVCCAQELIQLSSSHMGSGLPKKLRIILISATETLKEVSYNIIFSIS
jgi:NADH dehydrogenase FAD-containing subunit